MTLFAHLVGFFEEIFGINNDFGEMRADFRHTEEVGVDRGPSVWKETAF
jgi:hypothetical protein